MLNPSLFPAFIAVAETGSFSRAGERTAATQSSISQQIRRLEQQVGTVLFDRNTHRVSLTAAGTRLLRHANTVLDAIARADEAMRHGDLEGHVRLGIAEDFAFTRLPRILRSFRQAHPGIRLDIAVALSGRLEMVFGEGKLDIAVLKTVLGNRPDAQRIMYEPLAWVCGPDCHDLAAQRPLPLALHNEPSVTRQLLLAALSQASIPWTILHESDHIAGLRAGILAGMGISAFGIKSIPPDLEPLTDSRRILPLLPVLNFVMLRNKGGENPAALALEEHLLRWACISYG